MRSARHKTRPIRSATLKRLGSSPLWERISPSRPAPASRLPLVVHAPNHLGDTVMAVPFVQALRAAAPREILVVTREEHRPVWQRLGAGVATLSYTGWCGSEVRRLRRRLAERRESVAFLLATGIEVAWLYCRAGVRHRLGYDHWGRGFLLSGRLRGGGEPTDPSLVREPYLENLLRLFQLTDLPPVAPPAPPPALTAAGPPALGLVLGGETADKRPPTAFWQTLLARLAVGGALGDIVLLGTDTHADVAAALARRFPGVRDLCGGTSVEGLADALEACDVVVSPDSGAAHLATALGVPTVALFTSGSPAWHRPTSTSRRATGP